MGHFISLLMEIVVLKRTVWVDQLLTSVVN